MADYIRELESSRDKLNTSIAEQDSLGGLGTFLGVTAIGADRMAARLVYPSPGVAGLARSIISLCFAVPSETVNFESNKFSLNTLSEIEELSMVQAQIGMYYSTDSNSWDGALAATFIETSRGHQNAIEREKAKEREIDSIVDRAVNEIDNYLSERDDQYYYDHVEPSGSSDFNGTMLS